MEKTKSFFFISHCFTHRSCRPRWRWPHHSPERDRRGGRAEGRALGDNWQLCMEFELRGTRQTQAGIVLAGRTQRPRYFGDSVRWAPGLSLGRAGGSLQSGPVPEPAGHTESCPRTLTDSKGQKVSRWKGKGNLIVLRTIYLLGRKWLPCHGTRCYDWGN